MASVSYSPDPSEAGYYGALFRAADVQGNGKIAGAEAVQFMSRSKLPVSILQSIWTVADQPSTSYLDPPKFAVALRLIQLTQNGQKGQGPNLAAPAGVTLRPVFFEGVSGVSVPLPGQPAGQQAPPPATPQTQRTPPRPVPQQQAAVGSPSMGSVGPPPTPSRALVGPDPYSMTPQERAQYEALFPQYAKPDGFVYGPEAVALFTKSGVDPATLRDIWNMVDRGPVDNRLDKLEFALSMHLIVCVSKKNLPLPSGGSLPNSLRALKAVQSKSADAASVSTTSPTAAPQQPPPQQQPAAAMSPMSRSQMPPPQPQYQQQMPPPQPPIVETVQPTPMTGGPPPVEAAGGMSISDAFEGLSMGAPETSTAPPPAAPEPSVPPTPSQGLPSYVPEVPPVSAAPAPEPAPVPNETYNAPPTPAIPQTMIPEPPAVTSAPLPAAAPVPAVDSSSYDLGDAHSELDKLKGALQKLQAENISLKAQLGNMSEEEKDVQRELGATVAEIGKLTSELTLQRQKVVEARNRLLEASAELKAHQEQKGVLTDLIAEAKQTESSIVEATEAIKNADKAAQPDPALQTQTTDAMNRSDMLLFGYEEPKGNSAPVPVPSQQEPMQSLPPPDAVVAPAPAPIVETVPPTPATASRSIPEPTPAVEQSPMPSYGAPAETAVAPVAAPSPGYYNYSVAPAPVPPQPESFVNDIPPQTQPTPTNIERPAAVAEHHRQDSGFGSGFVMGGSAAPIPQESQDVAVPPVGHSAARTHSSSGDYGFEDEESFKIVEDMKKKAERAAEVARDAEAASSRLAAEADELRTDADRADANARTLRAAADEKKKGRFGGGKKKAANREAERAAEDAVVLRKRFMAIQTQVQDAQKLASDTRREANRLKDEAEKAEIDMASAASLRDQQKAAAAAPPPAPVPAPAPYPSYSNGYGPPATDYGYGQPAPAAPPATNSYAYGQPMGPPDPSYSYGMPPPSNGYAQGVMAGGASGGGGFDLPPPSQFPGSSDPYGANPSNPF